MHAADLVKDLAMRAIEDFVTMKDVCPVRYGVTTKAQITTIMTKVITIIKKAIAVR